MQCSVYAMLPLWTMLVFKQMQPAFSFGLVTFDNVKVTFDNVSATAKLCILPQQESRWMHTLKVAEGSATLGITMLGKVRERHLLLMLGVSQALTPISPLSPYLNTTVEDSGMLETQLLETQQPAQLPWPLGVIQHTTTAAPRQTSAAPLPQASVLQPAAAVSGASQKCFRCAPQPQLAPMFQPIAAAA